MGSTVRVVGDLVKAVGLAAMTFFMFIGTRLLAFLVSALVGSIVVVVLENLVGEKLSSGPQPSEVLGFALLTMAPLVAVGLPLAAIYTASLWIRYRGLQIPTNVAMGGAVLLAAVWFAVVLLPQVADGGEFPIRLPAIGYVVPWVVLGVSIRRWRAAPRVG